MQRENILKKKYIVEEIVNCKKKVKNIAHF